jgi:hypothetical protein
MRPWLWRDGDCRGVPEKQTQTNYVVEFSVHSTTHARMMVRYVTTTKDENKKNLCISSMHDVQGNEE